MRTLPGCLSDTSAVPLHHPNSGQGQNSLLPLTSPVNETLVEPSLTPVCCICTWPQSSSAVMRRKSFGPSPFSEMDRLQGGPRTSFTRRWTLASFPSNPGPTLNNNSGVNSFWSMQKWMLLRPWKALHITKKTSVTPYKCLNKISSNLYPNNQNNWLENRAWPPRDVSLDTQS